MALYQQGKTGYNLWSLSNDIRTKNTKKKKDEDEYTEP